MKNEKMLLSGFKEIVEVEFKREYQWIVDTYAERSEPYSALFYMDDYLALSKCCEKYQCSATTFYRLDYLSTCGYDDVFVYVQEVYLDYVRKLRGFIERRHPGFFDSFDK